MRRPLVALIVLLVALAVGYTVRAADDHHSAPPSTSGPASGPASGSPSRPAPSGTGTGVALSSLPPQAGATVALIRAGGPFPYPRNDGVVFHNNEHRLPTRTDGYYREYTVPTPGTDTRGARRIITGRDGEFYYTADHYEHFVRVDIDS